MALKELRELVSQHLRSSAILSAVGASLDAQLAGTEVDPAMQARIDELSISPVAVTRT